MSGFGTTFAGKTADDWTCPDVGKWGETHRRIQPPPQNWEIPLTIGLVPRLLL